jgi:hypothetical protein
MNYAQLHFHSNITVVLRDNGCVAFPYQCDNWDGCYYGYGVGLYKRGSSDERGQLCEKTSRVWTCVIELL